jgi:hypothetical protein
MIVTKVSRNSEGLYAISTNAWVDYAGDGTETPFSIYLKEDEQLLIKERGFVYPEELSPGDEIKK